MICYRVHRAHENCRAGQRQGDYIGQKQTGENPFPVTPEKYERIMIMPVHTITPEFAKFTGASGGTEQLAQDLKDRLKEQGLRQIFLSLH